MKGTAFAFVCALAAPLAAQTPCTRAFTDSLAQRDLTALARVAAIAPVWDTYSLANHALLLVADSAHRGSNDTPVCAAIWRFNRELDVVELARRPQLSTPLYGMVSLEPVGVAVNEWAAPLAARLAPDSVLRHRLASRQIDRAVVLPFPMDFTRLGAMGAAMRQAGINPALLQADFAVHEGYHLHVQFPAWLGQGGIYAWPSWDRQPDRQQLRERCYAGSEAITDAVRREHAALLLAFDGLDSLEAGLLPRSAIAERAARFVTLRGERYALLDSVRVDIEGRAVTCAEAEDVMELQEGTSQWVGHATTVRAGLVTRTGKRGSYARPQPEAFYQLGPLQLWIMDALLTDDAMRSVTARMARSTSQDSPDGSVFRQFRAVVVE